VGCPPFFSEKPQLTCSKILSWRKHFSFPSDVKLSLQTRDLITRLITDPDRRLGKHGVEEVKAHPFFIGID